MIERFKERRHLVKTLLLPMALYLLALAAAMLFMDALPPSPLRVALLLSPVAPAVFFAVRLVQLISKLDEMNRKILTDGTAVSFALTFFLTLTLGLLEMGDILHVNNAYVGAFMVFTWLAAKLVISRRYE